jgi:Xaa-Pro aminopeptidase
MIQAASIKRQKRTIMNFQENALIPFIKKAAWRYIQFNPSRYPTGDYKFIAYSSMGIMAKELEMTQMIQLLSMTQAGTEPFAILLMGIFENSSMSNRDEMKDAVAKMMQPNPEEEQLSKMVQQLELMKLQTEIEEMSASAAKDMASAQKMMAEIGDGQSEVAMVEKQMNLTEKMAKIEKLKVDISNVQSETMRNIPEVEHLQSETILNLANARKAAGR